MQHKLSKTNITNLFAFGVRCINEIILMHVFWKRQFLLQYKLAERSKNQILHKIGIKYI